jgi:glycosyltransferase involved in cell wall biosynthesis
MLNKMTKSDFKKKILIVVGSLKTGGAERMAINTGESLNKNGYEVHYFLQKGIIEIPNSIEFNRIHIANMKTSNFSLLNHLTSIVKIFFLNQKLKSEVVIGYTFFSSFISCFSFSSRIIGRFDVYPFDMVRPWKHFVAKFVASWPYVNKIVVPSHGIANKLKTINSNFKKKTYVIHNSIDKELIRKFSNDFYSEYSNTKYISAMGRFTFHKNFELLIDAYIKSAISKNYKLIIIGDGSYKDTYLKKIRENGFSDKIIFTGFLKNPFPIIKDSFLFINTSLKESFCNVILEAAILNVPVIATDCDFGPSEIIKNNFNGILVENDNLDQLVKAMDTLSNDEDFRYSLAKGCENGFLQFEIDHITKQWLILLSSMN